MCVSFIISRTSFYWKVSSAKHPRDAPQWLVWHKYFSRNINNKHLRWATYQYHGHRRSNGLLSFKGIWVTSSIELRIQECFKFLIYVTKNKMCQIFIFKSPVFSDYLRKYERYIQLYIDNVYNNSITMSDFNLFLCAQLSLKVNSIHLSG